MAGAAERLGEIDRRTAELRERFAAGEADDAEVDRELRRLAFDRAEAAAAAEAAAGRGPRPGPAAGWDGLLLALAAGVTAGVRAFRAAAAAGGA